VTTSGELHIGQLRRGPEGVLVCASCERGYPVVDEIPIVVPNLEEWLESERLSVLCRDLPRAARELLTRSSERLTRDAHLTRIYRGSGGQLPERVRDLVAGFEGQILDLGCGPGLHDRSDVVGLELNFALARAFPGRGVIGDAANPPFLAHAFDAVLALNLLDSVPDPRTVLGQADALLCPGGTLVLACPYAWDPSLTPREAQFSGPELLATLAGDPGRLGLSLRYELLEVEDRCTWRLEQGPRTVQEHACQLVVARKLSEV
jgi:SAM-dependent methyltransferase